MSATILLLLSLILSVPYGKAREGEQVVDIRVTGNQRVSADQLLSGMRTRVGQPLSSRAISEDIRDLFQRYGVRITVIEEASRGGVVLTLDVAEEALVTSVEATGVSPARARELLDEVSLGGARSLLASQVKDRALTLQRSLREQGHYFAEVGTAVENRDGLFVAVLEIHEGPKVEVDEIRFVGLESLDPDHLRDVMTTRATRLILLKAYLRQDVLDRDIIELQRFLHSEGFRDGQASLEKVEFNVAQDEAVVTLRIQEGTRYTVGQVRVEGNSALLDEELYAEILLATGAPVRMVAVEKDRRRLLKRYGELGHVRCQIEAKARYEEQGTEVQLTFVINEGPQKHVRDVYITGNTNTRDEIIRRESTLAPGDLASSKELRRTSERLRKLGFFRDNEGRDLVHVRFKETGDPLLEDLFIDVEETQSGRLLFTAGASTDLGFYAGVNLVKNNFDLTDAPSSWDPVTLFTEFYRDEAFHGGGQRLVIQAQPGNDYSRYLISFTEPYLTGPDDQPVSFTLDAYYQPTSFFDEFEENRLGLGVTLDRQIDDNWNAGVTGKVELVSIDDVDSDAPGDVKDVEGGNFVPSVGVFARYKDVDSIIEPTDGFEVGGRYEVLAADAAGHRAVVDGTLFIPVMEDDRGRQQVVALRGSVGAAQGFGGDLPFFERFSGGGASGDFPIRGFRYRRVGPESKDVHLGGELGWSAGAEYRFPVYSSYDPLLDEEIEIIRGVLFADAGAIEDDFGALLGNPRLGVGAGVRVRLPFIGPTPVALDLGFPILSQSDDETQYFSVRVSTRF